MKKSVALVMPVRNEAASVNQTLSAVLASTRLPDEIIIADGMSTDNTADLIRQFPNQGIPIKVVANPSIFAGGGRNRAIEQSCSEIILLADFGNKIDIHWIENMVRPFEEDDSIDVVAGWFKPLIENDFQHCMASIHYYESYSLDRFTQEQKQALVPSAIIPGGLSVGITKKLWEKVGGFPEWLKKGQDKMFSRKAHALGAKAVIGWDAWIYHHIRNSPKEVFNQLYYYGKGNGQMRYISPHFIKLAGFYGILAMLLLAGFISWAFPLAAGILFIYYYYTAGLKKVYSTNSSHRKLKYCWLTLAVLIPRDMGTLCGHIAGWSEWIFVKRYRELFKNYTLGCNTHINDLIAK